MILRKYQAGKMPLRLPIMIFLKNVGILISRITNVSMSTVAAPRVQMFVGTLISRTTNVSLAIGLDVLFKDNVRKWIMKYLFRIDHWMPGGIKIPDPDEMVIYELGTKMFQAGKDIERFYKEYRVYQINYPAVIREGLNVQNQTISAYLPMQHQSIDYRFSGHIYQENYGHEKTREYGTNNHFLQKLVRSPLTAIYNYSTSKYPKAGDIGSYDAPAEIMFSSFTSNMLSFLNIKKGHNSPAILYHANIPAGITDTGRRLTIREQMGTGKSVPGRNYIARDIKVSTTSLVDYNSYCAPPGIINKQWMLKNTAAIMKNPLMPDKHNINYSFNAYHNTFQYKLPDHNSEKRTISENYTFRSGFDSMEYSKLKSMPDSPPANSYDTVGKVFTFDGRGKIEREINEIKKMIVQTKESIKRKHEPSHELSGIDVDINEISEQVYKDIEKNIMIERERRGL